MRELVSGNGAAAWGVRRSKVQIVPAYPITPQTEVVEKLSDWIEAGKMDAKFLRMESEHSVAAALVGASMAGARTFTATSGQGTLYMMEMIYWMAGTRLPVVMATANRGIAPPWNIWGDWQEVAALQNAGVGIIVESNPQAIFDTIPVLYKTVEDPRVLVPFVISYEGFLESHGEWPIYIPSQTEMDEFLPELPKNGWPHVFMDPENPATYGSMQHPDTGTYAELRAKMCEALKSAGGIFEQNSKKYTELFGRYHGGLIKEYKVDDAEAVLVSSGTLADQAEAVVDKLREKGKAVGSVKVRSWSPFPGDYFRKLAKNGVKMKVLSREIYFPQGGSNLEFNIHAAIEDSGLVSSKIIGLGGRQVTPKEEEAELLKTLEGREDEHKWAGMDIEGVQQINYGTPDIESNWQRIEKQRIYKRLIMAHEAENWLPCPEIMESPKEQKWVKNKDGNGKKHWLRGNTSCPGCGSTLALRHVLDVLGSDVAIVAPANCANVYVGIYPRSAAGVPWTNMAFAAGAAAATGMKAAFEIRGKPTKVMVWAGDGGTYDIGIQGLSGAAERRSDIIYFCYNNKAYMNTGTQASSATEQWVVTTTTSRGKIQKAKDLPMIMNAHGLDYLAVASSGHPTDLRKKVKEALKYGGVKYIEIFAPCPPGWKYDSGDLVPLCNDAVKSGYLLLFEIKKGKFYISESSKLALDKKNRAPLRGFLERQGRFKQVFDYDIKHGDEIYNPKIHDLEREINHRLRFYAEHEGKRLVYA